MQFIDFTLYNLPMLLTRNKSKEWREQILARASVLISFFNENNLLISIIPFDDNNVLRDDLVIKRSNVTDEGLELFKSVIPEWSRFLDKGGKLENVNRLEKGLKKIREARR